MPAEYFPEPVPLDRSKEERDRIAQKVTDLYSKADKDRQGWYAEHLIYDQMFRGSMEEERKGPWEGSADLHIAMPYWAVDAINTRLVTAIWGQTPLVGGEAEEDDDQEILRDASKLVDWHLQPKRMKARQNWSLISKTRCVHGLGVGLIPYVKDSHTYRSQVPDTVEGSSLRLNPDGSIQLDETGQPIQTFPVQDVIKERVRYDGPILQPLEWDDVITPAEWTNLQPNRPSNPQGADWVGIRQWEPLSLMWRKRDQYAYIEEDDEAKDKQWWIDQAPSQDRSGTGPGSGNQERAREHDRFDGRNRNAPPRRDKEQRANPEFENLYWFMPWEVEGPDGEKREEECLFYVCTKPRKCLGAYRLTDVNWHNDRPLLELHYQRVGVRGYSMGVMEIAKHLSAELDTIHNMRLDVGFATNLPFFFYRASVAFNPENIEIRPLKGIPVDDANDIRFPQMQNVTSFYHQEEQLLYTLVERVLGVTDLFLGISPTQGAAARHATGFVGTQQEALARTSEVLSQDAEAASFLFHSIYNLELQFGPDYRMLRLQGREGPSTQRINRDELWFRGEYDFRLGSNQGMFSTLLRQQQGRALLELRQTSPLIAQDPGRQWEVESFYLHAIGITDPEVFIGPKDAVSAGSPKKPEEENGEMDQFQYGVDLPAPVHPNDDDQEHLRKHVTHLNSTAYNSMGAPNTAGFTAHLRAHAEQIQRKQLQQQMQMLQAGQPGGNGQAQSPGGNATGPPPIAPSPPGLPGQDRIVPQLMNVGQQGKMGDVAKSLPLSQGPSP